MSEDKFQMLYCDDVTCRVNTFERGDGSDQAFCHTSGLCPGCGHEGMVLNAGTYVG